MTLRVGLSGGLACGKSTVCGLLQALGTPVVEADALYAELQRPGSPVLREVAAVVGSDALDARGALDVEALRVRALREPGLRPLLGRLVHVPWFDAVRRETERICALGPPLVVVAVPMLFESRTRSDGGSPWMRFDRTVCVWAPREAQIARTLSRDGGSAADAEVRLARQLPSDAQRALADHVLDNSGPEALLRSRVEALHGQLLAQAARPRDAGK